MSALQSPFNAGFGMSAQATRQPALSAAAMAPIGGFAGVNLPGVRRQPMNQAPLNPEQSYNLNGAANLDQLMQFRNQYDQQNPLGPQSPLTSAQQAVLQQAGRSRSPFIGRPAEDYIQAMGNYVRSQTQGQAQGGARAMNIARSRAGSLQRQQPISAGQLSGSAASLLGRPDLMEIAAFEGAAQLPTPLQPLQQFQTAQQQQFPTGFEELLAEQERLRQPPAFGAAATAPANLGGVGQLGATAPMAARYRHNSSDGLGAQAYAGAYGGGRASRRNSMGLGQQSVGMNPFATQSFAGHYGSGAASGRTNFAGHYDDADAYGEDGLGNEYARNYAHNYADNYAAGQYGNVGRRNFAGQYGSAARSNFAGQYGSAGGASRQRRASLGVGGGF
nr:hypothetical protein [Pandoravirus massiliensis]